MLNPLLNELKIIAKMLNLPFNDLKVIAKSRAIKEYKSMSEERLLSSLNELEPVEESEKNFHDARIIERYTF